MLAQTERGTELGSAILDWASLTAKADGKRWLRLDAWTANLSLLCYYLTHGFEHVRTVEGDGIVSGALFERDAGITLDREPQVLEQSLPN